MRVACPLMWSTPPFPGGTPGQPPGLAVLAARTGDLSAVPGVLTPGTADKSGRRPGPGRSPAGPGCPVRAWIVPKPAPVHDTPHTQVDLGRLPDHGDVTLPWLRRGRDWCRWRGSGKRGRPARWPA